jgi:hypothetical protein
MRIGDYITSVLCGAASGWMGSLGLYDLLTHANLRSDIIQAYLARSPEISNEICRQAEQFANSQMGNNYVAITSCVGAGAFLAASIYFACNHDIKSDIKSALKKSLLKKENSDE